MNKFSNSSKSLLRGALAAAAVTAALTGAVRADEVPQVHVKYADLNVNSNAGATVLYQRIRRAAEQVCTVSGARDLGTWSKREGLCEQGDRAGGQRRGQPDADPGLRSQDGHLADQHRARVAVSRRKNVPHGWPCGTCRGHRHPSREQATQTSRSPT